MILSTIDLIFIAAGILLFALGIVCAMVAARKEARMLVIADTPTTAAGDVERIYRANGAYGQACEIAGVIECDAPLSGPLTGQSCVAYSHLLRWEDWGKATAWDHNRARSADGLVCRDSGTEFDDRCVPTFWVRDASGQVQIDPINADLDLQELDQRYDVTLASVGDSERRTWRTEKALPTGHAVYVLGYLAERQGAPVLQRHPTDRTKKFLISHRSEQKLIGAHRVQSYAYYFAAGISGSLGLVMLIWRFLQLRIQL
jgi:hypothetical protein